MNLQLRRQRFHAFAYGSTWLFLLALFCSACARPTPIVLVITATPFRGGLVTIFTTTSEPTATKARPSSTAAPTNTTIPKDTITPLPTPTDSFITWDEAAAHVGEEITLCGPVMGVHFAESSKGQPTFLNIGEKYPNPDRFTIVIWAQDRDKFPEKPEELFTDQEVCITGIIEEYDEALEIVVSEPEQIVIQ